MLNSVDRDQWDRRRVSSCLVDTYERDMINNDGCTATPSCVKRMPRKSHNSAKNELSKNQKLQEGGVREGGVAQIARQICARLKVF